MKQPHSTEAYIAHLNRDKVHPDVALHTHVSFMSSMRDWLDEIDPFVKPEDYSRQDLFDLVEGLLDMYDDKL